jgi:serine/threonine protein kinase
MVLMMLRKGGWEVSGYTKAVDWWSLGVTMYKLLTGAYPFQTNFGQPDADAMTDAEMEHGLVRYGALLEEVDYGKLSELPDAVDCISKLLTVEEKQRLGYGPEGWQDLSSHPFFCSIDWVALEQKQVPPPALPSGFAALPVTKSYQCIQHMFVAHDKTSWMKLGGMGDPQEEMEYLNALQEHFEFWDYTAPAAIIEELEAAGSAVVSRAVVEE